MHTIRMLIVGATDLLERLRILKKHMRIAKSSSTAQRINARDKYKLCFILLIIPHAVNATQFIANTNILTNPIELLLKTETHEYIQIHTATIDPALNVTQPQIIVNFSRQQTIEAIILSSNLVLSITTDLHLILYDLQTQTATSYVYEALTAYYQEPKLSFTYTLLQHKDLIYVAFSINAIPQQVFFIVIQHQQISTFTWFNCPADHLHSLQFLLTKSQQIQLAILYNYQQTQFLWLGNQFGSQNYTIPLQITNPNLKILRHYDPDGIPILMIGHNNGIILFHNKHFSCKTLTAFNLEFFALGTANTNINYVRAGSNGTSWWLQKNDLTPIPIPPLHYLYNKHGFSR